MTIDHDLFVALSYDETGVVTEVIEISDGLNEQAMV